MRRVFKLVFLFVGVVIGAGFATGSEIVLYFKNSGYFSVLLASLAMGVLSIFFCYFGKLGNSGKFVKNLMKIVVFFCSIVTYCVMISGTSELIFNQFGIRHFGILTSFIVAILMLYDIKIIKLLNVIIVPIIVIIMIIILSKSDAEIQSGVNIGTSLKYAGMNMLLSGYFLSEEGKDLSHKQIALTGICVTIAMGTLMSICYFISMQAVASNMPIFEVARSHGLGLLAAIVVYFAIFTTLIGSGRAFADMTEKFVPNKIFTFVIVFVLGCYFDKLNFGDLVNFCYGEIGKIGLIICIAVVANVAVCLIRYLLKDKLKTKFYQKR